MKATILLAVAALALTTGFTCSKNTPAPEAAPATETTVPAVEAAPADAAAPAEGTVTETTAPVTQ